MSTSHVLGLAHTRTTREYSVCAFTAKARNLVRMLHERGHTVYHYGTEGSDPACTEHVSVLSDETFRRVHGAYDYRRDGFRIDRDNHAYREFTRRAIREIARRARPGDFLCATYGLDHKEIAEALPELIAVESGIGYEHCFARFRVYESQAWRHYHDGKDGRGLNPDWYHVVIPNAIDLADFPYQPEKRGYHLFLGRDTPLKGRQIAIDACRELGIPLYVAGQGDRAVPEGVTHLGVLGPEDRARWLGGASALWAPTQYLEPWGNVVIEAMATGTPAITPDFGAFTENVIDGETGYRCRTFAQFLDAARRVGAIDPAACRRHAERFSLDRVGVRYEAYFADLARLHADPRGWYAREEQSA